MIIKIILTALLAILGLYAARNARGPLVPIAVLFVLGSVVGVVLVWNPDLSNNVAKAVGIGRGADLIFYLGFVFGLFALFILHLRMAAMNRQLTTLARHIALATAREPAADRKDTHAAAK